MRNFAERLLEHSNRCPDKLALIEQGASISFRDFTERVLALTKGLTESGLRKGDRIFILAPPAIDLYALLWASFYLGLTPVFAESGMPKEQIKRIFRDHRIHAVFSIRRVLAFRFGLPKFWRQKYFSFDSGGLGVTPMERLFSVGLYGWPPVPREPDSEALLTFTTGSTGNPKGANRQFDVLLNQHLLSRKYWPEDSDEVDMPGFAMVVMQNLACGITTVLPKLLGGSPADIDPQSVFEAMERHGVTRLSGSPGFMKALTDWMAENGRSSHRVRRLIVGGAQVPVRLARSIRSCFPDADAQIVYGSTEAEPIAHVALDEHIASAAPGYLLGQTIAEIDLRIVRFPNDDTFLPEFAARGPGAFVAPVGEILIHGPHVIRAYIGDETANRLTKLIAPDGIWHRTGDFGYLDETGRVHLLGRSQDRLPEREDVPPFLTLEKYLEEIAGVERAAVAKGDRLNVVLQGDPNRADLDSVQTVLRNFQLADVDFLWTSSIPVDHRHKWKIDRSKLQQEILTLSGRSSG